MVQLECMVYRRAIRIKISSLRWRQAKEPASDRSQLRLGIAITGLASEAFLCAPE